jgi:hypothetical protein
MVNAGLVGVDASIIGLGLPDKPAPGVLMALNFGVFRAARRGVFSFSTSTAVSSLDSVGRSNEASGRVKSSIMVGISCESLKFGEAWMRMRDAGVAGVAGVPCPFIWAIIAGDAVREDGFGGGRISDSMGSGDIESVSEVSLLYGTSRPFPFARPLRASCMSSLTSLGGMKEDTVAFRLPGFTMGDCRTRLLAFVEQGAFLLLVLLSFRPVSCCIMGSPSPSISTSMGEWPVELPDVVF